MATVFRWPCGVFARVQALRDLILNHKDPSVTEAHYSQGARMERQVRQAFQIWSDHVWEITGQGTSVSNVWR